MRCGIASRGAVETFKTPALVRTYVKQVASTLTALATLLCEKLHDKPNPIRVGGTGDGGYRRNRKE